MIVRIARRLRWALLGTAAAALMAVSVAGATDNAPLVVAQINSATQQTALQGSMASPVLLITNFSTAAGAYGLSVNGNSSSTPAIGGGNGGTGIGFRGLSTGGIGALGIHVSSSGTAPGAQGETNSTTGTAIGVLGRVNPTNPGDFSAAVRGINNGTGGNGIGVFGSHAGGGWGVYGTSVTSRGVYGSSSSGAGVYGTSGSGFALHAVRSVNANADPPNHVALVENTSAGTSADVLALKIGNTSNPATTNNFITFFKGTVAGTDASVGAIEGNGIGGVVLSGPGSDYAEWLPKLHRSERLRPGEIVGLYGGKVTKATAGATRLMVVSSGPIVAGNDPGAQKRSAWARAAFVGQAPVRVRGRVDAGDLIVASGRQDGTGVAVAPRSASGSQLAQALGEAWSGAAAPGVKLIRVAVGLGSNGALQALSRQNRSLENRLERLERELASLKRAR
jgi:hypothetical protein